jgi:hypothetical protein
MLISLREFARRNGVDVAAISRAVKAGRLPGVDGKIDPEQAQPVWDRVKDRSQVGRKLKRGGVDPLPVNTASGPSIAVTVAVNGAEELGLAKAASDLGVTLQSLVLTRCGVQTWRLGAPARATHRSPVRMALDRRSITVYLSPEDHATLKAHGRQAGLSLPQYMRTRCG